LDEDRKAEVRVKGSAGSILERLVGKDEVVESFGREGGLPGVLCVRVANAGLISARVKKSEEK
jgi:hypothetical protein